MPSPIGSAASVSQWPIRSRYTPTGDRRSSQRASSPSEQSSRICSWIASTAPTAGHTPGSVSSAAAASPTRIISQVTPLGEIEVRRRARVR
jgi:hypothetical protein